MSPTQAFAKVLKHYRNQKKLSQLELALEANLDRTYISLLERGLRQPSLSTIFQIADVLQVNPEKLIEHTNVYIQTQTLSDLNNNE